MGINLKTITFIILMLGNSGIQAQLSSLDSLENKLSLHKANDTLKVKLLNEIAFKCYRKDINKTYEYAIEAYRIADSLSYLEGMSRSLLVQGIYYDIKSEYPEAIKYYQEALKIFEKLDHKRGITATLHNIGIIYKLVGDYEQALIYYMRSLEMEKEMEDKRGTAISYYTIANIYVKQEEYDKAVEYYTNALDTFKELDANSELATCLNNLGIVYNLQDKKQKAEELFNQSLKLSLQVKDIYTEAHNYIALGEIDLDRNKPNKALAFGEKAYKIAQNLEVNKLINESAGLIAKSSAALGMYKKAYKYYVVHKTLSDSILNEDQIRKTTALEYQYRFEKEKHAMMLEQQKKDAITIEREKRQNIIQNVLLFGSVTLLILISIILYAFIQKRKANKILKDQKSEIQVKSKKLDNLNKEIKELAESLNELNATKDKFFSIIAHDLKSPFSSVFGLSESLLEDHETMSFENRKLFIERLYESSKHIYKLLENLLTWAQLQRGALKLKFEPFKICDLVNGLRILLDEKIKRKEISFTSQCGDDCNIIADKNMIETVIRNLLSNALKFTPKGGKINISGEKIENNIQVSIKDNGIGIPLEAKNKLFNLSENKSTLGTENETGSGLGLILCKEFIEKHKGKIWVESEVDKGSTFHFTVPQ